HRLYGLRYSILRFANVYGPGQSAGGEGGVVAIFVRRLLNGQSPDIYGDGEQTRDFVFVEDVAAANALALRAGHNRIINIGHGSSVSINELLKQLAAIAGTPVVPVYRAPRAGDIRHSSLNGTLAHQVLGWKQQYDLRTGLQRTLDAFRRMECEYAG
ncbi:MAG: NAD-dependent epimerase/dehydratase family protein, partial [Paenibacillaceae bacterium]|nr:NAD-dependent epimerase/dehydratase family protein [Paenibacillaceae bacterium]